MIVGGIDYSITSPAICVHKGEEWNFDNCFFWFCTEDAKLAGAYFKNVKREKVFIQGYANTWWETPEQRFDALSDKALHFLEIHQCQYVQIEDYSFASRGRVFNIGENTGLLKHKLFLKGYDYEVISPKTVKKFATGNGNSDKFAMLESFVKETKFNFDHLLDLKITTKKIPSPITDLVDAYYLCKYNFFEGTHGWKSKERDS